VAAATFDAAEKRATSPEDVPVLSQPSSGRSDGSITLHVAVNTDRVDLRRVAI